MKLLKIFSFVILVLSGSGLSLHAADVSSVRIIGNTVRLGYVEKLKQTRGEVSEHEIREITSGIISAYRNKGYEHIYIESLTLSADGELAISIIEPRIALIWVAGDDKKSRAIIEDTLAYQKGKVINALLIRRLLGVLKSRLGLYKIDYEIEGKQTPAVILKVTFQKENRGQVYGHVNIDFVYGLSPMVGYYHIFDTTGLDVNLQAGVAGGGLKKIEGNSRFYLFAGDQLSAYIIGLRGGRTVDYWELFDLEYTDTYVNPAVGYRVIDGLWDYNLFLSQTTHWLSGYNNYDGKVIDVKATAAIERDSKKKLKVGEPGVNLRIAAGSGWESKSENVYTTAEGELGIKLYVIDWYLVKFYAGSFYTSSDERFNWLYVYNYNFIVDFKDYITTSWKNVAGFSMQAEVVDDLFLGPFINSGYFLDEREEWRSETGTGVKCVIKYEKIDLNIIYAWNINRHPDKGGIVFFLQGRF